MLLFGKEFLTSNKELEKEMFKTLTGLCEAPFMWDNPTIDRGFESMGQRAMTFEKQFPNIRVAALLAVTQARAVGVEPDIIVHHDNFMKAYPTHFGGVLPEYEGVIWEWKTSQKVGRKGE
jgi:hypothetical protein